MKIDFHVHTNEYSGCAINNAEEQIQGAIRNGADAIFISEHDRLYPQDKIDELNKKYAPFKVFQGIEVTIGTYTANEHFVVLGVHDKRLEERRFEWSYEELYRFVKENDGYICLCHPYRYRDTIKEGIDVEKFIPDSLELYSSNIGKEREAMRIALSEKLGCRLLTNSDSHASDTAGGYVNTLEGNPTTERDIIDILKSGKFTISEYNAVISKNR